jgi:hypothetical protein
MMKARFKLGHVWLLCIVLSLVCAESARPEPQDININRLARAYREARTDLERRTVCLEAIDAGLVARGHSVAVIDAVFGTTYAKKLPPTGSKVEWGVVEFHPLPSPPSDATSAAHMGWFLAFEFDSSGAVQNYYLSNLHK